MSKYDLLAARLARLAGPEWRASFAELEAVLGAPLPKGARTSDAWWKNDAGTLHAQAWTAAGWEVTEVDQAGGTVTFRKSAAPAAAEPDDAAPPAVTSPASEEPAILKRLEATPKWNLALVAGGLTIAAGLSVFAIRGWMRKR
ncbi:hypothetical protein [Phenylobacterium sp.]|uniref:DUF7662 domain-containing protein n=1 Tax=Phenylobacterium sp. TaxID=1871053 RepID=UPI0035698B09